VISVAETILKISKKQQSSLIATLAITLVLVRNIGIEPTNFDFAEPTLKLSKNNRMVGLYFNLVLKPQSTLTANATL